MGVVGAVAIALGLGAVSAHATSPWEKPPTGAVQFIDASRLPSALNATSDDVSILDVREDKAFARGHLPRAQSMEWEDTRAGIFERGSFIGGKLPNDLDDLVYMFVAHGITVGRPVLVCGDATSGWGEEGRIAWTLAYLGHPRVFILDGGCTASSLATSTGTVNVRGSRWTPRVRSSIRAHRDDVLKAVRGRSSPTQAQILDVRTAEEFGGATPYFEARGGHIEGAHHLHYQALLDDRGRLLSPERIRARLAGVGIDV